MNSLQAKHQTEVRKRRVIDYVARSWKKGLAAGWSEIVAAAEIPNGSMPRVMRELEQDKKVICIGTALDAGRKDMRGSYKVYAPYGTEPLARVEQKRRRLTVTPFADRPKKYKGEIAPKHYSEWRTPELTINDYDIYQARTLAMLTR